MTEVHLRNGNFKYLRMEAKRYFPSILMILTGQLIAALLFSSNSTS